MVWAANDDVFGEHNIHARTFTLPDVLDTDGDGVPNASDNCPSWSNPEQADIDNAGQGDACDAYSFGGFSQQTKHLA